MRPITLRQQAYVRLRERLLSGDLKAVSSMCRKATYGKRYLPRPLRGYQSAENRELLRREIDRFGVNAPRWSSRFSVS